MFSRSSLRLVIAGERILGASTVCHLNILLCKTEKYYENKENRYRVIQNRGNPTLEISKEAH